MNKKQLLKYLADIPIFADLTAEERKTIAKYLFTYDYKDGAYVFKEGTHGGYMFFIVSGTVDVIKQRDTSTMVIAKLTSGHSVGEMSLIDGGTRSATVKATSDLRLVVLKQSDFKDLLAEHPKIANKVVMEISRLLSKSLRGLSDEFTEKMLTLC